MNHINDPLKTIDALITKILEEYGDDLSGKIDKNLVDKIFYEKYEVDVNNYSLYYILENILKSNSLSDDLKKEIYKIHVFDNDFWDIVFDILNEEEEAFIETKFLREMQVDCRIDLYKSIFYDLILNTNDFEKKYEEYRARLTYDEFLCFHRVEYTMVAFIISHNKSKNYFKQDVYDMFRFDTEEVDLMWQLINDNKDQLTPMLLFSQNRNILSKIDYITESIKIITNIFKDILSDNE